MIAIIFLFGVLVGIAITGWFFDSNLKQMEELLAEMKDIEAKDKFYGITNCSVCGRPLRLLVQETKGHFRKQCPEDCETHHLEIL